MAEERRITKQDLLDHLDENELDLSMINLSKVPVKELVRVPACVPEMNLLEVKVSLFDAHTRTCRHKSHEQLSWTYLVTSSPHCL